MNAMQVAALLLEKAVQGIADPEDLANEVVNAQDQATTGKAKTAGGSRSESHK